MNGIKLLTQKRMYILGNDDPESNVGSGPYIDLRLGPYKDDTGPYEDPGDTPL